MDNDSQRSKARSGFFERFSFSKADSLSEDDIREAVGFADDLTQPEKQMINEIIDLGDATADEICIPRVDIMLVEGDESARVALERMRGTGYSRLLVCGEDIDDVLGVVNYKDLIAPLMDGSIDDPVSKFIRETMFVPETKNVIALLREMQAKHQQLAVVVDEYGGTKGIITIEDILEEIVGDISDEYDTRGDMVTERAENQWRVEGRLPIEDAEKLGWPVIASDDYETIAGWLMAELDSVPNAGDQVERDGYTFTIVRMRRSRIATIYVDKDA